jgi:ElaB/YqjD/DUF883 family membrane-anchored ribosome-binding protein
MTTNGQRRPQDILAQIDRTRGDMDSTLRAIEQRLSPGQLLDQGLDYLRHSGGNEFVSNLGGSVRDNPVPVALVGIGLAWLMAAGRSDGANGGSQLSTGKLSSMKDQAGSTLQSAKDQAGAALQSARDRATQVTQGARDTAMNVAATAREQTQRVTSSIDNLVHEQPLALGAIGFAIGAVLAAAAPRTRQEDELMGEASDRLTERAKDIGKEQLQKVQQTVAQGGDGAKEKPPSSAATQSSKGPSSSVSATPSSTAPSPATPSVSVGG